MKAILKFDLSDSEDQQEFYRSSNALNMALAIWEYDQYLRGEYKHGDKPEYYEIRNKFREFLASNDIDIDRIVH